MTTRYYAMKEPINIVVTVDYPEGCRGKVIRHSRRLRFFPRELCFGEVLVVEGKEEGRLRCDVFRVVEEPLWRLLQ